MPIRLILWITLMLSLVVLGFFIGRAGERQKVSLATPDPSTATCVTITTSPSLK